MTINSLDEVRNNALSMIESCKTLRELEIIRLALLGKNGILQEMQLEYGRLMKEKRNDSRYYEN